MPTPLRILLAPDKFKGSLSAEEVCQALELGISKQLPNAEIRSLPLADGGDGTLAILANYLNLKEITVDTVDPLGRPIQATYLVDEKRAFIEVASASGMVLLTKEERNPMHTSTYGTGLMVKDAIEKGKTEIYLLLGGSATNDMGLGIASALGVEFEGTTNLSINGGNLSEIKNVSLSAKPISRNVNFTLFCDVTNPIYGPNGAAHVYARQKGASDKEIELLDQGLRHVTTLLQPFTDVDLSTLPGGGAAGGIGIGMLALFKAKLQSGFAAISELTSLEKHLEWADVVLTGEGQIDSQSLQGKVVGNIVDLCLKHKKPCHVVVGHSAFTKTSALSNGITSLSALTDLESDVHVCMTQGARLLEEIGERLTTSYFSKP